MVAPHQVQWQSYETVFVGISNNGNLAGLSQVREHLEKPGKVRESEKRSRKTGKSQRILLIL